MNRKNYFKTFSTLFMLVMLAFGCQPVSDDNNGTSNSDSNSEKTFTITFDANGGSGEMKSLTVKSGKSAELPANTFTKEGYDFGGWVKNKTSTAADYADKASIEPKENVTLYALWNAKKITITFDANGGTEAAPEAIEATAGLVELPKMGGKFSHWNTKADGSGESYQENGIFTANITLYAIYLKAGEYKITYHLDGGVNNPNNPLIYKEGEKYYLEAPTREGYSFVGWKDSKGNITKGISLTPDVIASDLDINNLEFTAVWTLKKYKIIYHSNCDELEDVTVAFAPEDGLLADYPFSRDEYTFAGYYANEACTEELSETIYIGRYILARNATGDIHLYAAWKKNVYVYDLKIKVANLPDKVKALSMWGTPNEWKLENIQKEKDLYIAEVKNGTAEFSFDKLNILMPLWCQFMPMTSKDMEMNNSTWWQTTFSGSSVYANAQNNLVYDFAENIVADKMILTLDTAKVYGSLEDVFEKRFFTENYRNAFEVSVSTGKYKIIYNDDKSGDVGYQNNSVTSFDATSNVVLTNPKLAGYKFLGWYENKTFSGKPITGWAAGEKTADVKLWAKWEKETPEGSDIYLSGLNGNNWATDTAPGKADFMTKGDGDIYTFTFKAEESNPFPYGFKFTTENGCMEMYQAYNKSAPTTDFTISEPNKEASVYYLTKAELEEKDADGNSKIADIATKFKVKNTLLCKVGSEYTVTFDKANMKMKISGDFEEVSVQKITVTINIDKAKLVLKNVPTYNADDVATINGSLFGWCLTLKSTDCEVTANWSGAENNTWVAEQQPKDAVTGADAWAKLTFSADGSEGWVPYSTTNSFEYDWTAKK